MSFFPTSYDFFEKKNISAVNLPLYLAYHNDKHLK